MMSSHFYSSSLLRIGARHLAKGMNCQDHVAMRISDDAVILAVADGVSGAGGHLYDRPSRTEVGAYLTAEIAANAAARAVPKGLDIVGEVAQALTEGLAPLAALIRQPFASALPCTLVLAVATPRSTSIWLSGDGAWGCVLPPGRRASTLHYADLERDVLAVEAGLSLRGSHHQPKLGRLASTSAVSREGSPAAHMELVFHAESVPLALWVASDGLEDEPAAMEALRRPITNKDALLETLLFPVPRSKADAEEMLGAVLHGVESDEVPRFDDLGVGFMAVRHPSLISAVMGEVPRGG